MLFAAKSSDGCRVAETSGNPDALARKNCCSLASVMYGVRGFKMSQVVVGEKIIVAELESKFNAMDSVRFAQIIERRLRIAQRIADSRLSYIRNIESDRNVKAWIGV